MKVVPIALTIVLAVAYPALSQHTAIPPINAGTEPVKRAFTQEDIDKLIKDNKILMLDFSAVWCQPCKEMAPVIDEIEKENPGKIKVVRIDYDLNRQLANNMFIYEIPFLQIYVNGKISQNLIGVMAKEKIMELVPKNP